jgi:hypothetical protein
MAYSSTEAREQLLADVAAATDEIGQALACLGEAYEQLDERSADQLEERLFRPVQLAYGKAQRTHSEFAGRFGFPSRSFQSPSPGAQSQTVSDLITHAVEASAEADRAIADLQDSMMPVEVGDPALRAGLSQVREQLAVVPHRARDLLRVIGR